MAELVIGKLFAAINLFAFVFLIGYFTKKMNPIILDLHIKIL